MNRLIVLLALAFSGCTAPASLPAFQTIMPLQQIEEEGQPLVRVCTTWSLNEKAHYYVTAAHCVVDEGADAAHPVFIGGLRAAMVRLFEGDDIVVLQARYGAPALHVARTAPTLGTDWSPTTVHLRGFPYGFPELVQFDGRFSHPRVHVGAKVYALFDITAAPGNSGSPIYTDAGVISLLQQGWGRAGGMSGGITYEALVADLQPYGE